MNPLFLAINEVTKMQNSVRTLPFIFLLSLFILSTGVVAQPQTTIQSPAPRMTNRNAWSTAAAIFSVQYVYATHFCTTQIAFQRLARILMCLPKNIFWIRSATTSVEQTGLTEEQTQYLQQRMREMARLDRTAARAATATTTAKGNMLSRPNRPLPLRPVTTAMPIHTPSAAHRRGTSSSAATTVPRAQPPATSQPQQETSTSDDWTTDPPSNLTFKKIPDRNVTINVTGEDFIINIDDLIEHRHLRVNIHGPRCIVGDGDFVREVLKERAAMSGERKRKRRKSEERQQEGGSLENAAEPGEQQGAKESSVDDTGERSPKSAKLESDD